MTTATTTRHEITLEEFGPRRAYMVTAVVTFDDIQATDDRELREQWVDDYTLTVRCTQFVSERVIVDRDAINDGWFAILDAAVLAHLESSAAWQEWAHEAAGEIAFALD